MVQRDQIPEDVNDIEQYLLLVNALEDASAPYEYTPYGATKTAEINVQFGIDPSFGLSRQRYGWYSNETLYDGTFFSQQQGKIKMETSATAQDIARLRSAFPGQYLPHTIAEPGLGARIPRQHLEYDSEGFVSLTHGEIGFDIAQWSDTNDRALNSHGFSFESDAVYAQVRSGDQNVEFVPQREWNIDKMDGNGPSQTQLRPENGYIFLMIFSWYGEGAHILAVQDPQADDIYPVHKYIPDENHPTPESPNMPVMVTVENKSVADPLGVLVGGMQFTTHGGSQTGSVELSRQTQETRQTGSSYIDRNVVLNNNAVDPFAQPGRPLVSVRRDLNDVVSRKSLAVDIVNEYINSGGDVYLFLFDEPHEDTALTGANWHNPAVSGQNGRESGLQFDTSSTDYTPSADAGMRGIAYIAGGKQQAETVKGDTTSRVPLETATVVTAALPVGSNSTYAQPFLLITKEGY